MTANIIEMLRQFAAPNVFNPWTDIDILDTSQLAAERRCLRLTAHFLTLPRYLLIGEAPGYQGCHFSGVPFTNESLICGAQIPRIPPSARFTTRALPWCEPSATIVWGELHRHGIADSTVMWNAFAFHPHKPGEPYSNRRPSKQEVRSCAHITRAVLEKFAGTQIIAVGQVAGQALRMLDIFHFKTVRHPAMGGATEFRTQLAAIVEALQETGTPTHAS